MRLLAILFILSGVPALAGDWKTRAGDIAFSHQELTTLIVGQTLVFYDNGRSVFAKDGAYSYIYDNGPTVSGTYQIEENSIVCIDFENGFSRCDKYVLNADQVVLLSEDTQRYPVRP